MKSSFLYLIGIALFRLLTTCNTPKTNADLHEKVEDTQEAKSVSAIKQRVIVIIADKLGVSEREVIMEAYFMNDLGADSLDMIALIMEFEKEFNITVPDDTA